jgi:transposase-like protein
VLLEGPHAAVTAPNSIDPTRFLHEQLASASPGLLRSTLTTFINTLMSAEVDAVRGAGYGQRSGDRATPSPMSEPNPNTLRYCNGS